MLLHRETSLEVFVEGDVLYDAMLSDIGRAERSVRLESYILTSDAVGRVFLEALSRCAARGIDVSLRADHAGSWRELDRRDIDRVRATGVRFEYSRPWSWRRPFALNRRNHRKLLAIDGAIAYVGGFNLHVPSSQRAYGPGRWRDTHVRFLGAAAAVAAIVFDTYHDVPPDWMPPTTASPWLLPNRSKACRHRLRCVLQDALRAAQSRVWATTPYFVPDRSTQTALCHAALHGADVRLLVPGKSDVPLAQWAARAAYSRLLSCGVRIFEYAPRVLHAKTMLVDAHWATVGTANLDYRSLFVNDELNLIDEVGELNLMLAQIFLDDLREADEVLAVRWSQRRWQRRVAEAVGWWARRWL
jgi:cardiolipin synthase